MHIGRGAEAGGSCRVDLCLICDALVVALRIGHGDFAEVGASVVGRLAGLVIVEVVEIFAKATVAAAGGKDAMWFEKMSVDDLFFSKEINGVVVVTDFHVL